MTETAAFESPHKKRKVESENKLKMLLFKSYARSSQAAGSVLEDISFDSPAAETYTKATEMLRGFPDTCKCLGESCNGLKAYKLPEEIIENSGLSLLDLNVRPSKLYVERGCYRGVCDQLFQRWQNNKTENIIVTGNAGIGKSWFQVYVLQRLLALKPESRFVRFVLRQYKDDFSLIDLDTCENWVMNSANVMNGVRSFLRSFKEVLYLYEPGENTQRAPVQQAATPCLATLSPNPARIKEYSKEALPGFLYMPTWNLEDLEFVAGLEEDSAASNSFNLNEQYQTFGGIIRHTLNYDADKVKTSKDTLEKRIATVKIDTLRSMHVGLDDNSDGALENNISGFICAYTDIPETGDDAFKTWSLTMTSQYACDKVRERLSLADPREHASKLLLCLHNKAQDISGMDLEVTAANILSCGSKVAKWEYNPVGIGQNETSFAPTKLGHTKMDIHRADTIDKKKLNYPTNPIFGLVDFFIFIKDECWAFQTTWQNQHPFKLRTLWSFRSKIGTDETTKLNILYVVAPRAKIDTYKKRPKLNYLVKGDSVDKPIMEGKREVLAAGKVKTMWENTNIHVAYPEEKDWFKAVEAWLKT